LARRLTRGKLGAKLDEGGPARREVRLRRETTRTRRKKREKIVVRSSWVAVDGFEETTSSMRDIITRVKYEPNSSGELTSSSSSASLCSTLLSGGERDEPFASGSGIARSASLVESERSESEDCERERQSGAVSRGQSAAAEASPAADRRDPLERIRSRGAVRVLPSLGENSKGRGWRRRPRSAPSERAGGDHWLRKLTATHWQPPTDGRQYELRLCAAASGRQAREQSNRASLPDGQVSDRHEHRQSPGGATSGRDELLGPSCGSAGKVGAASSWAATRADGPGGPIVRHSTSSSKRLLRQLARLRRLEEPDYRVRRSASAAPIEKLIEQLERAASEWDEDEHLLDRAERRDLLAQVGAALPPERPSAGQFPGDKVGPAAGQNPVELDSGSLADFGRRQFVHSLERDSIARSHSSRQLLAEAPLDPRLSLARSEKMGDLLENRENHENRPADTVSSDWIVWRGSSGGSQGARMDRFRDDLAVRRLSRSPSASSARRPAHELQHQMSYLLCSNAYTPPIGTSSWSRFSREHHLHKDDLHFRTIRDQQQSNTLPRRNHFGVPPHCSASHQLGHRQRGSRNTASLPAESEPEWEKCPGEPDAAAGNPAAPETGLLAGAAGSEHLRGRQSSDRENPFRLASRGAALPLKTSSSEGRVAGERRQCNGCQCAGASERLGAEQALPAGECSPLVRQSRPESRVSFKIERRQAESAGKQPAGKTDTGRSSADSGFAAQTNPSSLGSPLAGYEDQLDSESPGGKDLLDEQWAATNSGQRPNLERNKLGSEQQVFVETDLDAVPVADWCWVGAGDQSLGGESVVGESAGELQFCQARLSQTPSRRRPKINMGNPRSKGELVRVSTSAREPSQERLDGVGKGDRETVVVQTYWDSMKRKGARRSEEELECEYQFDAEEEEEDEEDQEEAVQVGHFRRMPSVRRPPTTRRYTQNAELRQAVDKSDSGHEELQTRSEDSEHSSGLHREQKPEQKGQSDSGKLRFSIGEYKSLNRSELKIL